MQESLGGTSGTSENYKSPFHNSITNLEKMWPRNLRYF